MLITLYPITGVMLGAELQTFEESHVFVLDLLIIRVMFEWDRE